MNKLFIAIFIALLFICQYFLYRLRKPLSRGEKDFVVRTASKMDLFILPFLIIGYLFLVVFTSQLTLIIYMILATAFSFLLARYHFRQLQQLELPKDFCQKEVFLSFIVSFTTLIFGMLLLITF